MSNRCNGKSLNGIEWYERYMTNVVNLIKELGSACGRFSRFLHCISMTLLPASIYRFFLVCVCFVFFYFQQISFHMMNSIASQVTETLCIAYCMQYAYYAVCSMYVHLFE